MSGGQTFEVQVVFQKAGYALKGFETAVVPIFLVKFFSLRQSVVFLKARRGVQNRFYFFKPFVCSLHQLCRTDFTAFEQFAQCSGIVQAQCIVLVKGMQACVFRGHCDFL